MEGKITIGAVTKMKIESDLDGIHSGMNVEFALGATCGVSFGILGLFMACFGFFSGGAEEASIINQAAIKFITIAVPSLLVGLYGFYKIEMNKKAAVKKVSRGGSIKLMNDRFSNGIRVRRNISLQKDGASLLKRMMEETAIILLLIVFFSFAATLFLLTPYGSNDTREKEQAEILSLVQTDDSPQAK